MACFSCLSEPKTFSSTNQQINNEKVPGERFLAQKHGLIILQINGIKAATSLVAWQKSLTSQSVFLVIIYSYTCPVALPFYLKGSIPVMVFSESEKNVCIALIIYTLLFPSQKNLPLSLQFFFFLAKKVT